MVAAGKGGWRDRWVVRSLSAVRGPRLSCKRRQTKASGGGRTLLSYTLPTEGCVSTRGRTQSTPCLMDRQTGDGHWPSSHDGKWVRVVAASATTKSVSRARRQGQHHCRVGCSKAKRLGGQPPNHRRSRWASPSRTLASHTSSTHRWGPTHHDAHAGRTASSGYSRLARWTNLR